MAYVVYIVKGSELTFRQLGKTDTSLPGKV